MKYYFFIFLCIALQLNLYADDLSKQKTDRMVLVELFTSQGCSSCPPADALLSRLAVEPQYKDKIIPLAFHVDYWDKLGWKDPFSHAHWTLRQHRYATMFQAKSIYTPQMVVDGRYQWVGSDEEKVRYMWDAALKEADAANLVLEISSSNKIESKLSINVNAVINDDVLKEGIELFIAIYENGFDTIIPNGENSGKTLHENYVVRKLFKESVKFRGSNVFNKTIEMDLDKEWDLSKIGVVAYLQQFGTRSILGIAHETIPINDATEIKSSN